MDEQLQTLSYSVEQVTFKNEESGFAVLQGSVDGLLLTAVGELALVEVGEELTLHGTYVEHPSFGTQFKVEMYERKLPTTVRAILKFLSSGAIKGIGEILAKRIVDRFGEDTFERIENDPSCLAEVEGISCNKAKKLEKEFEKLFALRKLLFFMQKNGLKETDGVRAWSKWGAMALEKIKTNPYCLCVKEIGVSFTTADRVAEELSFEKENHHRIYAGIEYVLTYNAKENGHTCVPKDQLLSLSARLLDISSEIIEESFERLLERGKVYQEDFGKPMIFLPEYYLAETYIAERLGEMIDQPSEDDEIIEPIISLEEERMGITFATLQKKAIKEAVANKVFLLTGGPGTGKTTILNAVISILEQRGSRLAICAPTGRAAKRLSEATEREATTIHRMLGVQSRGEDKQEFVHHEGNPLELDGIIIDEVSMVDSLLFAAILKAAPRDCQLILTGDSNQLPSVSAGNVLRELLTSDCLPSVELKQIFRQSAESLIITNAHAIVKGELPELTNTTKDFFFLGRPNLERTASTIVDLCFRRLPHSYGYSLSEDIQVICPSRKGITGTVEMNKALQEMFNPRENKKPEFSFGAYTFRVGDKVMQIKNNYDIEWTKGREEGYGIFNGDIGTIVKINKSANFLEIDFDGRLAAYTLDMAKELELAYAITVHKSQGNEFKAVVMPIMCGRSEFYNRNLLYTGITRAKELLILVGSSQSVANMTRQTRVNLRYTGVREFLLREVLGESK